MNSALIGYTGFVGGNIFKQNSFNKLVNSKNIQEIKGEHFDSVVCAGVSAVKWMANQKPKEDLTHIKGLITNLDKISAKIFILISTVDVYPLPIGVDEKTIINPEQNEPYGKNRYYLEKYIKSKFKNYLIVRLPGLFGNGIKKNFIFDLIHNNRLDLINSESIFQFYNLNYIWRDIQIAIKNKISLVNFAVEPVRVSEVVNNSLGKKFENKTQNPPVVYDMHSIHSELYGASSPYLYTKKQILNEIKEFIISERNKIL